jgi:hypothetical protein
MSICAECLEIREGGKETCILNAFKCKVVKCKKYRGGGLPAIKTLTEASDDYKKLWKYMKRTSGHMLIQGDVGGLFVLRDLMNGIEKERLK